MNKIKNLGKKQGIKHEITNEDLENNPGLEDKVKVGEEITIPTEVEEVVDHSIKEINGKLYREISNPKEGTTHLELIK